MTFQITIKPSECIFIEATKRFDYISTRKMLNEVVELWTPTRPPLFFLHFHDFETDISPFETLELFDYVSQSKMKGPFKIAFVHQLLENRMDAYHAENIGTNIGFMIRGFIDETEAKEWLFSDIEDLLPKK